jgi:hypothetical protein
MSKVPAQRHRGDDRIQSTPAADSLGALRPGSKDGRRFVRFVFWAGVIALVAYLSLMWYRARRDPALAFLPTVTGAEWILHDDVISLDKRDVRLTPRGFRTQVTVTRLLVDAPLHVRGMNRFSVLVDGNVVASPPVHPKGWKADQVVDLARHLPPGRHEIRLFAQNETGPPALWAVCEPLGLRTDASWESTADGANWKKVRLATEPRSVDLAGQFPSPASALAKLWPMVLFTGMVAAGASWWASRTATVKLRASHARWLIHAAWIVLAANNLFKLPQAAGFDTVSHLAYIGHVAEKHRIPLATDGWQMFQSPLYYIVSAGLLHVFYKFTDVATCAFLLRLLPMACGLVQIELCYRAARRIFPERDDLQLLGTAFAGMLPMNIYLSQYVGNEPLGGVLSAAIFVVCLKWIHPGPQENLKWVPATLGILFGLALLAKVSAVLIGFPMMIALAWGWLQRGGEARAAGIGFLRTSAVVMAITMVIAGWYYLRNWIHLGRPFVSGWAMDRGFSWWQDPGFRTASEFFSFGTSLSQPILAALHGFWDGLYASFWSDTFLSSAMLPAAAPKWNYSFMLLGLLLALVPTIALIAGAGRAIRATLVERSPVSLVTLACVGAYGLALLHHTLTLPYYCAIKAFYTIGAVPAYALLFLAGADLLTRRPIARAIFHGLIFCWAGCAFIAFLSRG